MAKKKKITSDGSQDPSRRETDELDSLNPKTYTPNIPMGVLWTLFLEKQIWLKWYPDTEEQLCSSSCVCKGKIAGLQMLWKESSALNCKGQRKQPTAAQSHPSKRPWDCSELPQLEPLCSLAKKKGKASCTDRPSSAGLGWLSQCESGTQMWAPSFALPPFSVKYSKGWGWNQDKHRLQKMGLSQIGMCFPCPTQSTLPSSPSHSVSPRTSQLAGDLACSWSQKKLFESALKSEKRAERGRRGGGVCREEKERIVGFSLYLAPTE